MEYFTVEIIFSYFVIVVYVYSGNFAIPPVKSGFSRLQPGEVFDFCWCTQVG